MKKYILLAVFTLGSLVLFCQLSFAQGCVAIRQFSGIGNAVGQLNVQTKGDLNVGLSYRYFKSFRHFRGTHEEPDRIENGTQVINWSHGLDFNIGYSFTDRLLEWFRFPMPTMKGVPSMNMVEKPVTSPTREVWPIFDLGQDIGFFQEKKQPKAIYPWAWDSNFRQGITMPKAPFIM